MTVPDLSILEALSPTDRAAQLDAVFANHTPEALAAIALWGRGQLAREDNFDGFCNFYWCIYGRELPKFQYRWYEKMQVAWLRARAGEVYGVLNEAARGLTKSTFNNTFVLHKMGLYPHLSHLIVQVRDEDSKKTSKFYADTLSISAGWKAVFPNVVPDPERGWNLDGYNIKDNSQDYAEFVKRAMADHGRDPSFMAVSVGGGAVGSHPTGCLVLDDICDETNTASEVENKKVIKKVTAEILPTMSRKGAKPLLIAAFTPWTKTDVYAMLKETGSFLHLFTPAFVEDENGPYEWVGKGKERTKRVRLLWEDGKPFAELVQWRRILGGREFKRMYLLDLEIDEGDSQNYVTFPEESINRSWPMMGGVDPSNTESSKASDLRKQSSFALAYVAKKPTGGAVIVDGVLEQCGTAAGAQYIVTAQSLFPVWITTIVEFVGYGRMWFTLAAKTPGIKIRTGDLKGFGFTERKAVSNSSKADRLEKELFPLLDDGIVSISSADTPFLNAARKLLQEFYTIDAHDPAWDAWDAIYQALKGMPDALRATSPKDSGLLPVGKKAKSINPMIAMLKMNARGN